MKLHKNKSLICSALVALFLILSVSCAKPTRNALPKHYADEAEIAGMPGVRDWGDEHSEAFQEDLVLSMQQYMDTGFKYGKDTLNIFALSGGGSFGAFACGVLNGWDAAGTRPVFKLVTGISTGSLIAPFAFLGGKYDHKIGQLYTSINTDNIMKKESLFSIATGTPYAADNAPLAGMIERNIDEEMLRDIAKAHTEGRRLWIGTTNLDAQRLVVWNMGAIASSGHPGALELFRKIILASAAMPVAFPPSMIEVEAGGSIYDEMHVDGGVSVEVFFYGDLVDIDEAHKTLNINVKPEVHIFIMRSGQLKHHYKEVEMSIPSIAGKAVTGLTSTQAIGDLYRIYTITQRDGFDYNMGSVPADYVSQAKEPFDPDDLKRLYDLGYKMALSGYPWEKYPPFYRP
jgi:hypothetical protein